MSAQFEFRENNWHESACVLCPNAASKAVLVVPLEGAPDGQVSVVECTGCGLRRLSPRPSRERLARYYAEAADYNAHIGRRRSRLKQRVWDALRDSYSQPKPRAPWERMARPVFRRVARWAFDINVDVSGREGLRVLEVGSGFGDLLIYLKSRGCVVKGVDPSPAAAEMARRSGVDVEVGVLSELKLQDRPFDIAIMCHSLEHVEDPVLELRTLRGLLKPQSVLHLAVPNGNAVRFDMDGERWMHLSAPFHYWFFSEKTLRDVLGRAGFELLSPAVTTTRHHALMQWVNELSSQGILPASQKLLEFFARSRKVADGGDVLRATARVAPSVQGEVC